MCCCAMGRQHRAETTTNDENPFSVNFLERRCWFDCPMSTKDSPQKTCKFSKSKKHNPEITSSSRIWCLRYPNKRVEYLTIFIKRRGLNKNVEVGIFFVHKMPGIPGYWAHESRNRDRNWERNAHLMSTTANSATVGTKVDLCFVVNSGVRCGYVQPVPVTAIHRSQSSHEFILLSSHPYVQSSQYNVTGQSSANLAWGASEFPIFIFRQV